VVSTKSKKVYERRLIVKYIKENGTDPITGDKLEESDLISIEASTSFYYRCPSLRELTLLRSRYSTASPPYPYVYPSTSSFSPK
jgi:hypothetical protein